MNLKRRRKNIMTQIRAKQILNDQEVNNFIEKECKLLTSKQLAKVLNVSDGALRKQRSNSRSIFPYAKINGRIFYPTDAIVKAIHNNLVGA
jgi:hypothetical protein